MLAELPKLTPAWKEAQQLCLLIELRKGHTIFEPCLFSRNSDLDLSKHLWWSLTNKSYNVSGSTSNLMYFQSRINQRMGCGARELGASRAHGQWLLKVNKKSAKSFMILTGAMKTSRKRCKSIDLIYLFNQNVARTILNKLTSCSCLWAFCKTHSTRMTLLTAIDYDHSGAGSVPDPRAKNCKKVIQVHKAIDLIHDCLEDIAKAM